MVGSALLIVQHDRFTVGVEMLGLTPWEKTRFSLRQDNRSLFLDDFTVPGYCNGRYGHHP